MAAAPGGAGDLPMGFMESGGPAGLLRAGVEADVSSVRSSSELLKSVFVLPNSLFLSVSFLSRPVC